MVKTGRFLEKNDGNEADEEASECDSNVESDHEGASLTQGHSVNEIIINEPEPEESCEETTTRSWPLINIGLILKL